MVYFFLFWVGGGVLKSARVISNFLLSEHCLKFPVTYLLSTPPISHRRLLESVQQQWNSTSSPSDEWCIYSQFLLLRQLYKMSCNLPTTIWFSVVDYKWNSQGTHNCLRLCRCSTMRLHTAFPSLHIGLIYGRVMQQLQAPEPVIMHSWMKMWTDWEA